MLLYALGIILGWINYCFSRKIILTNSSFLVICILVVTKENNLMDLAPENVYVNKVFYSNGMWARNQCFIVACI